MYELSLNGATVATSDDFNAVLADVSEIMGKRPTRKQVGCMLYSVLEAVCGSLSICKIGD